MVLAYRPDIKGSYGYWRCSLCGMTFYGGGQSLHKTNCPDKEKSLDPDGGYANCCYYFGRRDVERAIERARRSGDEDDSGELGPVSVKLLRDSGYGALLGDFHL
jgi:hypothetical protein